MALEVGIGLEGSLAVHLRRCRTVVAAFAAAVLLPEPGMSQSQTDRQLIFSEQCLTEPSSECLAQLVIPAATALDSPSTHLQGIAEALLLKGERDYAEQVLKAAIDLGFDGFSTETGFGANSDLWTVSRISRLLRLLDENGFDDLVLGVVELLERFLEREPESNAREQALLELFIAFHDLGELEMALSTADRTFVPASKWTRYGDVAVAYVEAGRIDEALAVTEKVGNPTFIAKARARVAAAVAAEGQIELAKDLLPSRSSDIEVTNAHKAIASALVATGRFDEAIAYANAISGDFQRAFVQDNTSGALAKAGELETAMTLAKSISVRQQRAQAMATVGEALVARGEIELARDMLAEMPRFALWQDPVDESIEKARARLERALDLATNQ